MRNTALLFAFLTSSTLALAIGCGGGSTTGTGGSAGSTTSTGGSGAGGSTTSTGGSTTGTGGSTGGSTTSTGGSTGGSTTTTGGSGTGGSTTTTTGTGGSSAEAEHLLISEIAVAPETGELIEIWNPTATEIDLTDYYLSDNSTYVSLASGGAWTPITNNPGTDFLARFPAGAKIPAGGVKVIGFDVGYEAAYGKCPDYYAGAAPLACGGNMVPALLATENGSLLDTSNLSNAREMVVLFTWSGTLNDPLKDVDYVTWGDTFENGTRADKTGVNGYQADTAPASQKGAAAPPPTNSIERCAIDSGEKLTGGNGLTGHDETSEDLAASFKLTVAPSPGTKNGCLP